MPKTIKRFLPYSAIFNPALEGGYDVSFPALPGCVTFGRTFEEAREKAQEVLELWLEELTSEGEKIPACQSSPILSEIKAKVPAKAKITYAADHC